MSNFESVLWNCKGIAIVQRQLGDVPFGRWLLPSSGGGICLISGAEQSGASERARCRATGETPRGSNPDSSEYQHAGSREYEALRARTKDEELSDHQITLNADGKTAECLPPPVSDRRDELKTRETKTEQIGWLPS